MKKELIVGRSSKLSLARTRGLLDITHKILARTIPDWAIRLWVWADDHDIDETTIPRVFEKLTQLQEIDLLDHNLKEFPKEFGNLKSLKKLIIGCQSDYLRAPVQKIPKEICNLTELRELRLSFLSLTELPVEIGNLLNLESLDLRNNYLSTLPSEIGNLKKLKVLDLECLGLTELPKEIGQLTNIEKLSLTGNKLTCLPSEIGNLDKLLYLDIGMNPIYFLPYVVLKLKNLKELRLNVFESIFGQSEAFFDIQVADEFYVLPIINTTYYYSDTGYDRIYGHDYEIIV